MHSDNYISQDFNILFKDKAKVHTETCDYIVILKPEQRAEFRNKIREKTTQANWIEIKDAPYSHHMLFEVSK